MNTKHPTFPRDTNLYKGGTPAAAQTIIQQAPTPVAAPAPTTPPITFAPPAPAASASATELTQAKVDAKKQLTKRQGINSTILGRATGDAPSPASSPAMGAAPSSGKNTLLGGG